MRKRRPVSLDKTAEPSADAHRQRIEEKAANRIDIPDAGLMYMTDAQRQVWWAKYKHLYAEKLRQDRADRRREKRIREREEREHYDLMAEIAEAQVEN
jgi:hypothetical protein